MTELPNNIRAIRLQRGLTLEQLAGLTAHPKPGSTTDLTTIQKLELGRRKLTSEWMLSIAQALGVDPSELLKVADAARPVRRVPLVGKIAAGNWREAIEDPIALVPTTKGGPHTFALTPEGDSMDLVIGDGPAMIFIDPDDRELVDGSYYAMMRPGGETTFKQFRTGPMRLEPCSSNHDHKTIMMGDEPLVTIGRVISVQRDL